MSIEKVFMPRWVKTIFWESRKVAELKAGEMLWFSEISDFPEYADSVLPFTLLMGHPNFRRAREVVRPGFLGTYEIKDLINFASKTQIAVDRLDEGLGPVLLEQAPTCCFRPVYPGLDSYLGKLGAEAYREAAHVIQPVGNMPFDMEMKPLFRDFRIRLIIPERLVFESPVTICFSLDAYKRIEVAGVNHCGGSS